MIKKYGLVGRNISHSFSPTYFKNKFIKENISGHIYELYDLDKIDKIRNIVSSDKELSGFNVSIPYKESIVKFIDELDELASSIGAVNCVKIYRQNGLRLKGFNTDYYGFKQSLKPFLETKHERALILGTGGASKAVGKVLKDLGISLLYVSRFPEEEDQIQWEQVNEWIIKSHLLIVNTTPLGTYPDTASFPHLPYEYITNDHFLYDLVYNPEESVFLKKGKEKEAMTMNGLSMLQLQAEKSWEIWNKSGF
jgi:shikimate dehydrogenase